MSNFVVVKFDDVSTYGNNPYKCVPIQWVSDSGSKSVMVPYPSKFPTCDDFETIIYGKPPIKGWNKYPGTIVRKTDTYCEGLLFILTKNSSNMPEHQMYLKYIMIENPPTRRPLRERGVRIWRRFCNLFRS